MPRIKEACQESLTRFRYHDSRKMLGGSDDDQHDDLPLLSIYMAASSRSAEEMSEMCASLGPAESKTQPENSMTTVAVRSPAEVGRPLRVLVPLIQLNLRRGDEAGAEYYILAGGQLREARPQVPPHRWSRFLTENFNISRST